VSLPAPSKGAQLVAGITAAILRGKPHSRLHDVAPSEIQVAAADVDNDNVLDIVIEDSDTKQVKHPVELGRTASYPQLF
jgi:hypothetical protein